jgi:hypothetical protein
MFETEALAIHLQNVDMMGQPVEQRAGEAFGAEDAAFVRAEIIRRSCSAKAA